MIGKSLSILGMLLTMTLTAVETEAKGWRGIVPLKSTRADVERLLGLPGRHGRYQFQNERAYIDYAGTGPCAPENACLCAVSEDTVISIRVELEVEMSFLALKLDKKKYEKFVTPQDRTVATYSRDKDGIIYTVNEELDEVIAIEYFPTTKDCEQALKRRGHAVKRPAKPSASNRTRFADLTNIRHEDVDSITYEPTPGDSYLRCARSSAQQTEVNDKEYLIRKFDEYSGLTVEDEKARLDNFAIYLHKDHPQFKGYIIVYGGPGARSNEAKTHAKWAKHYLVNVRRLAPARIITINGGCRDRLEVELYALPSSMSPPIPNPYCNK